MSEFLRRLGAGSKVVDRSKEEKSLVILVKLAKRKTDLFKVPLDLLQLVIGYDKYGPRVMFLYKGKRRFIGQLPRLYCKEDVARWVNVQALDDVAQFCRSLATHEVVFIATHLTLEDTLRAARENEKKWKRSIRFVLRTVFKQRRRRPLSHSVLQRIRRETANASTHAVMPKVKLSQGLNNSLRQKVARLIRQRIPSFETARILYESFELPSAYPRPSRTVLEARRTLTTLIRKYLSETGIGMPSRRPTHDAMAYAGRLNWLCLKLGLQPIPQNVLRNRTAQRSIFGNELTRLYRQLSLLDPVSRETRLEVYC
jgi:hypothetical protein